MLIKKVFKIKNQNGLHARPSASFVKVAQKFSSDIFVERNGAVVNGKSILGLMTLAVGKGSKIKITAEGQDADEAINDLGNLIKARFDEK
jgi:phosphocarrier protein HPr